MTLADGATKSSTPTSDGDSPACTLVIPTFDRPVFLRRLLRYYAELGMTRPLVVADSSCDEAKGINRETIASFTSLDVVHLDHYAHDVSPLLKVADAVGRVTTPYSVMCADDDFTTELGIARCVTFLSENPDYAIAQGYCIVFTFEPDAVPQGTLGWRQYLATPTVAFPDPMRRLYFHLSAYQATFYAVHVTSVLRRALLEAHEYTDDGRFGELLPSMLAVIMGKCRHLDVLFSARQSHPGMASGDAPTLADFMEDGSFEAKYQVFRSRLTAALVEQGADALEAGTVVDAAMRNYLSPGPQADAEMQHLLGARTRSGSEEALRRGFADLLAGNPDEFEEELERIKAVLATG